VYDLLHQEHLDRFYALRGARGEPARDRCVDRVDDKWLEVVEQRLRASNGPVHATLDVQGLHCVGCVWLLEELFRRMAGHERIVVNPSLGQVDMVIRPGFELRGFVRSVERFGYLFGPPLKGSRQASRDLLWRLGACAAIAMNSMLFAIAIYAGLDRGPLFELFTTLNLGLGALAVLVGGSVFVRSAWQGLRAGVLHLDLPIAIGIVLAFAGSVHSYFGRRAQAAYFDTLDVFIALMLLGRWLQERVAERNRAWLLASDGTDGLLARRLVDGRVSVVRCAELREGDSILVVPGDLVPVDARLEREAATFSLDWIDGESVPRAYAAGDLVPAGAFAAGDRAAIVSAATGFDASPLRELLRQPERRGLDAARTGSWWQRVSRAYVLAVLSAAAGGLLAWWHSTGDLSRSLSVATAVLIVTCPCALGIATPLGYEIIQARLRRAGLFVRRSGFLDRAREVRRVVFDKTGTLTTGALALENPAALEALDPVDRAVLYDLVARSAHPKSAAIREALDGYAVSLDAGANVVEHAGRGLELARGGHVWRLGDPAWVLDRREPAPGRPAEPGHDVAFGVDGERLAVFTTTERLRPDAAREVRALSEDYEVWLLSGDTPERVSACAAASGVPASRAVGAQSARDKARFLDGHDAGRTLFVGDGLNDTLALDRALVSGTPAVDRPFVPARADFFFITAGLAPIRLALRSARVLRRVVRRDLAIAVAYNAVAVGLALAGRMSPLLCAVLMPASSLTAVAATVASLSPRSRLWKS